MKIVLPFAPDRCRGRIATIKKAKAREDSRVSSLLFHVPVRFQPMSSAPRYRHTASATCREGRYASHVG